jgi:hypothetical protein
MRNRILFQDKIGMSSRVVNFRAPSIRLRIFVKEPLTIPDLSDINLPSDRIDTVDEDGKAALIGDLDDSSEELCTDIDEMHTRRALKYADIIIALYKVDESILGFLLAEFVPDKTMFYISLVCAAPRSGVGTRLIRIIKRIAFENDIEALVLNTVKSAKKFYSRRKFIETPTPTIPERMTYNMSTYAIAESRPRKTKGGRKLKRRNLSTTRRHR